MKEVGRVRTFPSTRVSTDARVSTALPIAETAFGRNLAPVPLKPLAEVCKFTLRAQRQQKCGVCHATTRRIIMQSVSCFLLQQKLSIARCFSYKKCCNGSFHMKSTSCVMKNFKRVHDSIKPWAWPPALSPNLSESSLAWWAAISGFASAHPSTDRVRCACADNPPAKPNLLA